MEKNSKMVLCKFNTLLPFSLLLLLPSSIAQLPTAEKVTLFKVKQLLEYPQVLQQWNKWTDFCNLPPSPSLLVACSGNHITELTIVGDKPTTTTTTTTTTLSAKFSLDSFFTVLTKLSSLKKLSLVSLGLWGPLPPKIKRLSSLEVLNLSSNSIHGGIPDSVATFKNLKSLVLSNNMFNGSVPDLRGLAWLEELDLSKNQLGPKMPSLLSNSLVRISLKNNSFRSQIPKEFAKFHVVQTLDLSCNKLLGPVPAFVFALPLLESLNLSQNQFSGALSPNVSCSAKLSFVDVSNNLLMGKLPACLGSGSGTRRVITLWNCFSGGGTVAAKYQRPLSSCQKQALAVEPPVKGHHQEKEESTLKLGVVLGVIGGVVAVIGVVGIIVIGIYTRVFRNSDEEAISDGCVGGEKKKQKTNHAVHGAPVGVGMRAPRAMRLTSFGLPPYQVFTLEEMEDVTDKFDSKNLVGEGSQGQMYRGRLRDGMVVLVRCLKLEQKRPAQGLQQHMDVISKLRHRHLVSVLGHCIVTYQGHPSSASTIFIVLENVRNGSLRDHLSDWRKKEALKWPQRMLITMGIAKGIQYLHTGGVTGNDLSTENILLDESLTPKISSYNILQVGSETPPGNSNRSKSKNTAKEDIYQLGIILLEVITGRPTKSARELEDLKRQSEMSLAESPSKLKELSDPSICGTFAYESLKTAVQIAMNCLSKDAASRPTIEDVLWHMQYSVQVQEGWSSTSGNLSTKF